MGCISFIDFCVNNVKSKRVRGHFEKGGRGQYNVHVDIFIKDNGILTTQENITVMKYQM